MRFLNTGQSELFTRYIPDSFHRNSVQHPAQKQGNFYLLSVFLITRCNFAALHAHWLPPSSLEMFPVGGLTAVPGTYSSDKVTIHALRFCAFSGPGV